MDSHLPDDVLTWTAQDVGKWLRSKNLHDLSSKFTQHSIDGTTIMLMNENDLKQPPLALDSLGHVKKLGLQIRLLQQRNKDKLRQLGLEGSPKFSFGNNGGHGVPHRSETLRLDSVGSEMSDDFSPQISPRADVTDGCTLDANGHMSHVLEPEVGKTLLAFGYCFFVFLMTAIIMAVVHKRVPDMKKYPPLPDLALDNLPFIPWAFKASEMCALGLGIIWTVVLLFHRHRFILLRRMFSLTGTVFLLRSCTMLITSLSVPNQHFKCAPRESQTVWEHALEIWSGLGMSLQGVRTCGDYMFSGHTCILTLLNFFISEYTPRRFYLLHTLCWVLNLFGIFFILAAHEHYSIDVFVAFYICSRLFLYYHTIANTRGFNHITSKMQTRIWFPLFSFFESQCNGKIPCKFGYPMPNSEQVSRALGSVQRWRKEGNSDKKSS